MSSRRIRCLPRCDLNSYNCISNYFHLGVEEWIPNSSEERLSSSFSNAVTKRRPTCQLDHAEQKQAEALAPPKCSAPRRACLHFITSPWNQIPSSKQLVWWHWSTCTVVSLNHSYCTVVIHIALWLPRGCSIGAWAFQFTVAGSEVDECCLQQHTNCTQSYACFLQWVLFVVG